MDDARQHSYVLMLPFRDSALCVRGVTNVVNSSTHYFGGTCMPLPSHTTTFGLGGGQGQGQNPADYSARLAPPDQHSSATRFDGLAEPFPVCLCFMPHLLTLPHESSPRSGRDVDIRADKKVFDPDTTIEIVVLTINNKLFISIKHCTRQIVPTPYTCFCAYASVIWPWTFLPKMTSLAL